MGGDNTGLVPLQSGPQNIIEVDMPRQALDDETISFKSLLAALRRRRQWVIGVGAAVVLLGVVQIFTTTPMYRSTTLVQIDPEARGAMPYQGASEGTASPRGAEAFLWTEARKVETRALARRVIERMELADSEEFNRPVSRGLMLDGVRYVKAGLRAVFGSTRAPSTNDSALIDRFLSRVEANVIRDTRLIQISVIAPSPDLASASANALAEEFIADHIQGVYESTVMVADFLEDQLQSLQSSVEESERAMIEYASDNEIVNVGDREAVDLEKFVYLSDELSKLENELIEKSANWEAVRDASPEAFPNFLKNELIVNLEQRRFTLVEDLVRLRSDHGPNWPEVQSVEREIAELDRQIVQEKRQAASTAQREYLLVLDRYGRLGEAVKAQEEVVEKLNQDSIQLNILRRDAESNRSLHEGLLNNLKEAGVAAGFKSNTLRVVEIATPPLFADTPKKTRDLVLTLLLALALGVATALGIERFDTSVRSKEDVMHRVALPTLGVIPRLDGLDSARPFRPMKLITSKDVGAPRLVVEDGEDGYWASEAYRGVRTSILLSRIGDPPQILQVTSALPGEGKSTTVANLAATIARNGAPTILVDADLRRPTMSQVFDVAGKQGLSAVLTGASTLDSEIISTDVENLSVLATSAVSSGTTELLGSAALLQLLEDLKRRFSYILIDTPPALEISDAVVLAPLMNGVILVARGGSTPGEAIRDAASRLIGVGANVLGVLVNDVDTRTESYGPYTGKYSRYFSRYGPDTPAGVAED